MVAVSLRADGTQEAGASPLPGILGGVMDWIGVAEGERAILPYLTVGLLAMACLALSLAQAAGALRLPGNLGRCLGRCGSIVGAGIDVMCCGERAFQHARDACCSWRTRKRRE